LIGDTQLVITDEKKRAIFAELDRILVTPRQTEDEVTTKDYAEFQNCTSRKAYAQLMKAVSIGKMTKRKVLAENHWVWAFGMVRDEEAI